MGGGNVEIEAKFAVRDEAVLDRLADVETLGPFPLGAVVTHSVEDSYLDTADRALLASGHTCRRRETGSGGVLITVKTIELGDAAVFRREELEVELEEPSLQPDEWPGSEARSRVMDVIGEDTLLPLLHLTQIRRVRAVSVGGKVCGELYLDDVRVSDRDGVARFYEVELESLPECTEEEFASLSELLKAEVGLTPLDRPKFLRALALVEGDDGEALLMPHELAVSRRIAELEDAYGRRARALLALHEGATQVEAGARAGFSSRWARHWLSEFRRDRMGIFPGEVFEGIGLRPVGTAPATDDHAPAPEVEPEDTARETTEEAAAGAAPDASAPDAAKAKKGQTRLRLTDTMAEAADKILAVHLERMTEHEEGTRKGSDIEELHDMRVATRRMRAALRLFDPFLDEDSMRPFLKSMRRTGRSLGAVRDLDVFREKAEAYLSDLPEGHRDDLDPLFEAWAEEYARCRKRMLVYLDGGAYRAFKEDFSTFLATPGAGSLPAVLETGEVRPYRVRDVLPYLIYEHAAEVWAYDGHTSTAQVPLVRFHCLRIAAKGLRYALEFFQEVLSPDVKELIAATKRLQDHLGDLQDAVVTCNVLRDYLTWGTWGPPSTTKIPPPVPVIVAPGVAAFLALRQAELQNLVRTFPTVWGEVSGPAFRLRLADVISRL